MSFFGVKLNPSIGLVFGGVCKIFDDTILRNSGTLNNFAGKYNIPETIAIF